MKKTLSVLLSLLMVLGCMTCLFTMPASAVETNSAEPTVETLPENLLVEVEDTEGREYTFSKEVVWKEFYQLDVVVTADAEDTNEYFFPSLLNSNGASINFYHISGVRYTADEPTNVETAYNNVGNQPGHIYKAPNGNVDESVVVAAKNVAGTYTYTYIVSPTTGATGISFPENVTIVSANLFELKDTDWNDFFWQGNYVFRYMVKEGNNVFQRFYGYRNIGAAAVNTGNGAVVSANVDGKLFNIEVKAGQTYAIDYDMRLASNATATNFAPGMDVYDTEFFDLRDEYKAIRDKMVAAGTASADADGKIFGIDEYKYVAGGLEGQQYLYAGYSWGGATCSGYYCTTEQGHVKVGQVIYAGPVNGYANGNWTSASVNYWGRRITKQNVATLSVSDSEGNLLITDSAISSAVGRGKKYVQESPNEWLQGTYTVTGTPAQTIEQGYEAVTKNNLLPAQYLLNATSSEVEGETVYNLTKVHATGTRVVPTGDTANVALSIGYIYAGAVYDFDNFEVVALDNSLVTPAVKGKDSNGNLKNIHANDDSTNVTVDSKINVANDTFNVTFSYDATREAYGEFLGWYKGDELISTEKTVALPYTEYKANPDNFYAVVEYENYMGNVGGFESYENQTNLMAELETITFSDGSTRTQFANAPTGEEWGQYEWNAGYRLPTGIDYDANVAEFITENGALTVSSATKSIVARKGDITINNSATGNVAITAAPYKGENVGYMNQGVFIAVKAIEGLTAGKTYVLSFNTAYCRSDKQGLMSAAVTDTPLDFNCYTRSVSAAKNREANTILGYNYCQDRHPMPANGNAVWDKVVIYFTATDDTEYFWMRTQNSQTVVDEFVCKEFNEINFPKAEWNFEDGVLMTDGFNHQGYYDMTSTAKFNVVDNNTDNAKLGDKYLNVVTDSRSNNGVNVNFIYNNNNRYLLSFDMKVNTYAGYVAGNDNKIEIFASKMNNMGYYQGSHLVENALNAETSLTRYYEDGTTYEKVINPAVGGQFMFVTQSGITSGNDLKFNEASGAEIWDEWQHFEIEIDPSEVEYNGAASFGIMPTGAGWDLSIDNIKINSYSMSDIDAADTATEGTKVFNIRAAGEGVEQGLRFKSTIDLDILDKCGNGSKVVEYGTLVMDAAKLNGYKLTRDVAMDKAKSGIAYVGVAYNRDNGTNVQYALDDETNVLTYTGVIVGVPTSKYTSDWAVRGYVIIEDANGNKTVVYDDVYTISLVSAATYIINESTDANDITSAQSVLDAYYR